MRCSTWGPRLLPGIAAAAALSCVVAVSPAAAAGWQVVPSPNSTADDALGAVLALSPSNVWAVGTAAHGNGTTTAGPLVEHFDGTGWQAAAVPGLAGRQPSLNDLAHTSTGQVWAVGAQSASGATTTQTLTARFG